LKKKKKRSITLAAIGVIAIAFVIVFNYSAEQTRIQGFIFGNELLQIQEDLKSLQEKFEANLSMYNDGDLSQEKFLDFAPTHVKEMEDLISRYDGLKPSSPFIDSVDFLKLSAESQLESQRRLISWVETGDEADLIIANMTHQQSFEFEMVGLASFNEAKAGNKP
jgi:hypothetical protein